MEEKTLIVFYTINEQSAIKTWTYAKMPKGWHWIGGGSTSPVIGKKGSKKISYLNEEQFNGTKDTQDKMKTYLINCFDKLKEKGIITKYKIRKSYKP
jgi:hypothetical protein